MNEQEIKQLIEQNKQLIEQNKQLMALIGQQQIKELPSKSEASNGTVLGNMGNQHRDKKVFNQESTRPTLTREERLMAAVRGSRTITQREPLILFVGPASCGKSMILMSLVEYLRSMPDTPYGITANLNYILNDPVYLANCNKFMDTLIINADSRGNKIPLDKTVDEVLVDINKNGLRKYSMLEAPGEDFFDIGNPQKPYRAYIKDIIQGARCPIFFVLLLDLHTPNNNFDDPNDTVRVAYESRLIEIINDGYKSERGDRVILLYNKVDRRAGNTSEKEAISLLYDTFYTRIKGTSKMHGKFLDIKVREKFECLTYMSGEYKTIPDDNGNEIEVYNTTEKVTQKVAALWNKLKYREL